MINNRTNVSRYDGSPPADASDQSRKIAGGPLYPKREVLALLSPTAVNFWSRGAVADQQKWKINAQDARDLVQAALHTGRYLGAEWCVQKADGPWAACDAYVVSRLEWNPHAHKDLTVTYYLKYAISKTGQVLLMASSHPEGA